MPILLDHFHELLHADGVMLVNVKENRTWSQPWFMPRCTKDRFHLFRFYQSLNHLVLDASALCAEHEVNHPQTKPEPKLKQKPSLVKLENQYTGLQVNPIKLFNQHHKSPVNYLMTQGYRYKKNGRLLPPHCNESTMAGVQVCRECKDGIERIYSHHGNDPLSGGLPHDSFDCFKILECNDDEKKALETIGRSFFINGQTLEKHNQFHHKKGKGEFSTNWSGMEAGL